VDWVVLDDVSGYSTPSVRHVPTLVGFFIAFAALVFGVWRIHGNLIQAVVERHEVSVELEDPFYPPVEPAAEALVRAGRMVLGRLAGDDNLDDLTEGSLEQSYPALSEVADGGPWFLSFYAPGDRPRYQWVQTVQVEGDVLSALRDLWDELPAVRRSPEVIARGRLKVDRIVGPERPFPLQGGHGGVALDKGLDGIVLRHPRREPFYVLPSWSIEGEARKKVKGKKNWNSLRRSGMHGRARRLAREMAGWKSGQTRDATFAAFRTRAWVEGRAGGGEIQAATRGNVEVGPITPEILRERIDLAGDYLKRETDDEGRLTYDYKAVWDEEARDYNILRHAGTTYSMLQAYRLNGDPELLAAAERAVDFFMRRMREDEGNPGEWFVVWKRRRAKLGGVGLGLCMMVELEKAAPGRADLERIEGMARHIERMQNPDGSFESFFKYRDRKPTDRKSIYYAGEAILGLVRLHQLTGDTHWLDIAVRGADYLVHERWVSLGLRIYVPPDAWLLQALEEMDRVAHDPDRVDYALAIASTIARHKLMDPDTAPPDFLGADISGLQRLPNAAGAGGLGEALSAAARLEARHMPGENRYRTFAFHNAGFQMRNQLIEANSWFLPNPARALGGFRRNPDHTEIRNDHVQHNLSGLFGLLDLLDPEAPDIGWLVPETRRPKWPVGSVGKATKGGSGAFGGAK